MKRGVLPVTERPKLYLVDEKRRARVDQGELMFGTNVLPDEHRTFAKIVHKAMADAELDFYYINELLIWAVGPDYQAVPLAKWGRRIQERLRVVGVDLHTMPVYKVFRILAELYRRKHKKLQVVV